MDGRAAVLKAIQAQACSQPVGVRAGGTISFTHLLETHATMAKDEFDVPSSQYEMCKPVKPAEPYVPPKDPAPRSFIKNFGTPQWKSVEKQIDANGGAWHVARGRRRVA
jgi:hypothetical protein